MVWRRWWHYEADSQHSNITPSCNGCSSGWWLRSVDSTNYADFRRADILYSSTWISRPRFPLTTSVGSVDFVEVNLSRFASYHRDSSSMMIPPWFSCSSYLFSHLVALRRVTEALSSFGLSRSERIAVSTQIYLTEHSITTLCTSEDQTLLQSTINTLDLSRAFHFAVLLYLRMAIRGLPPRATMHSHLVQRIRFLLMITLLPPVSSLTDHGSPNLLMWIAVIGGTAALETDDRQSFVGLLADLCRVQGIKNKLQLQSKLVAVCWKTGICDQELEELWAEIIETVSRE